MVKKDTKKRKDKGSKVPAALHWADQIAQKIIMEKGDKASYTVASGITPSGTVHIGNFREIITSEIIARALVRAGKKARFIYSWDNYDVFRKVPLNMPDQDVLKEYLRKPIVDTPDTHDCEHESYARHNEVEVEESIKTVGIEPEFLSQADKYRNCEYAKDIAFAMNNGKEIAEILNKHRKEPLPLDWVPASVFCADCGKDTTRIMAFDGKWDVTYSCECGFEETFDIQKKGIIKLKWRADWPMRWAFEKVDFEPGGKDHSTVGGSFDTGKEIVKLWNWKAPTYLMYDFIRIKGRGGKISSSKGNVITLSDVLEVYEPTMVRWLFAGTRPGTEFAIAFDADVIKTYEDFDRCERIHFGEQTAKNEKELANQKRIYELSCVGIVPKKIPFQPSFRHLCNILQYNDMDIDKTIGYYKRQLRDEADRDRLQTRAMCAKHWVEKYAPDDFKFAIAKKVSTAVKKKLSAAQKKAVREVGEALASKDDWSDEALHEEFYVILRNNGLETKDFFKAVYQVLCNADRGPKLAAFVLEIKDRAIELFRQV